MGPDESTPAARRGLLDTPEDPIFDQMTQLVCRLLNVPVALISLIGADRQFFTSQCGLPEPWATRRQTPLSHSFCHQVYETRVPLVIEDARLDGRVYSNPAVSDLGVVAYLGVPLIDARGEPLGSLCAIDGQPRSWNESDLALLEAFAAQVIMIFEMQSSNERLSGLLEGAQDAGPLRRSLGQMIAHDLRTPLAAMILNMELIKRAGPLNEHQLESLSLATRSGSTLEILVEQLRDAFNDETQSPDDLTKTGTFALAPAEETVEQLRALAADEEIQLKLECADDLPDLELDEMRVRRMLINLVSNAIKFTSRGGQITLKVDFDPASRRLIYEVSDNGVGVRPSDVEVIFDWQVSQPRGDQSRRSSGLGLAFCRNVARAHGGDLVCLPHEDGPGTTFRCELLTD